MRRFSPNRLYKNRADAKFLGVCAGIGDYFDISITVIRVLTILALFTPAFPVAFFGYFILAMVLSEKPGELHDPEVDQFWKDVRNKPVNAMSDIRDRAGELDRRVASLEAYITSERYKLDKEIGGLQRD